MVAKFGRSLIVVCDVVAIIDGTGEVSFLEIDQYSFSPGSHTLTIGFNLTTGREGEFQYNFTGQVRIRKLMYLVKVMDNQD